MNANAFTAREEIQPGQQIETKARGCWIKIFGMLNQSWAYVDDCAAGKARIWFVDDLGGVFDLIDTPSRADAEAALASNDWDKYSIEEFGFVGRPERPFKWSRFAGEGIYSTGKAGHFK